MTPYRDISGSSPIEAYELGTDEDSLTVRFRRQGKRPARTYIYTAASCPEHLISMIEHAVEGIRLATYIAQHKPTYARRW